MLFDEYIKRTNNSDLPQPLRNALAAFLENFQLLLDEPYIMHPLYVSRMVRKLAEDIFAEEQPDNLWWEATLYLAANWAKTCGEAGQSTLESIEALKPLLEAHFPNDDTEVTLKEITEDTVFGIMMLSDTLTEPKRNYVAPNHISLAQAQFSDKAWYRAIYAGKMPVGFVMLSIDEETPQYYIWRLMIAEPFHGRGYGRKAMEAIKAHVRTLPNAAEIYLSYCPGEGSPEGFYKNLGFEDTGEMHGIEREAKIEL